MGIVRTDGVRRRSWAFASIALCAAVVTACDANDGAELPKDGVTAPGPAHVVPTASASDPGGDDEARFAARAGIPPTRFTDAGADLDVDDQAGDGTSVRVRNATATRNAAYLVVFTVDGRMLGAAAVTARSRPATVALRTPVPASGDCVAVLFADDGDGRFELGRDPAINDGDTDPDDRLDLEDARFRYALR